MEIIRSKFLTSLLPFKYMTKFQVELLNYSTDIIMPSIKCQCTRFMLPNEYQYLVLILHAGLPDK